jgi:uncharacterized protein YaaQ
MSQKTGARPIRLTKVNDPISFPTEKWASSDRCEVRYNHSQNAHHDDIYRAIIMKLIVTIVDDTDVDKVLTALTGQDIGVTRVSSTGGLIVPGNSTLLIGVDENSVPQAMKVIAELAPLRQSVIPYAYGGHLSLADFVEVEVGGFLSFVLDVDHFEQV